MNYLPLCGSWFYGATTDNERASYFCSWGLLGSAPLPSVGVRRKYKIIGGGHT